MKGVLALLVCLAGSVVFAQQNPKEMSAEAVNRGQSMADAVLAASGADAAFFAAGLIKDGAKGDLAAGCQYPTDEIMVLELTGAQVKQALERSVSLHPSPNPGFLYLAGIEATFKPKAAPDARISEATINGSPISATAKYKIAMPGSLARGGLGYFSVWEKKNIVQTISGSTVESIMKGKSSVASASRWKSA